jgi:cyclic pyranopterin phosphate synthase
MSIAPTLEQKPLRDTHGRTIKYLRISVTDRCDLRCRYCMAEQMTFLPRAKLLSLEEIAIIAERFIARGVTKIRAATWPSWFDAWATTSGRVSRN